MSGLRDEALAFSGLAFLLAGTVARTKHSG